MNLALPGFPSTSDWAAGSYLSLDRKLLWEFVKRGSRLCRTLRHIRFLMKDTLPTRVRLGVFELDLRAGELRQGDQTIRLQEKSFRVLQILIERKGDLVTREEIQKRLWPNDTVVDFEHGINSAIKRLRTALGDSAESPKFVETVAGRGYRLSVPVAWVETSPIEVPPSDGVANHQSEPPEPWKPEVSGLAGKKVSHYRVLEVIGAGGMGLVYKAEDLKLGRHVALKFLPEELVSDPAALLRFEREAQTASSLNHPNICTIYEVEEHEAKPFIVMELLEGETLRERLTRDAEARKALPLEQLLNIGVQIAAGLQAAHGKSIIHRDIKPANIFLTASGQVKILDFGVAKLVVEAPDSSPSNTAENGIGLQPRPECKSNSEDDPQGQAAVRRRHPSATPLEATLTLTGIAMGTAGYMSPEQVRGENLDARTDLFSFGLVLYEMATGRRAFAGETAQIVLDAILRQPPIAVHDLNSKLPPELETIINKALQKDRELRYQSAEEMRADLQTIRPATGAVMAGPRVLPWKLLAAAMILIALILGGRYLYSHRASKLTAKDTIIIADFDNSTRDPVFDDGLSMALGIYLDQSPFFSRLSGRKLNAALKLLNHTPKEPLFEEHLPVALAREVCLRTNSKAMLTGTIADVGNRYRIEIRAVNCQTGATMATSMAEADNRDRVMAALGQAGAKLREELGEPSALRKRFDTPPEQALTSSPDALQAYMQGSEAEGQDAITYLNRATELDPGFAESFFNLGLSYNHLGSDALARRCWKKGYELRARLTQRRRLRAEGTYYFAVTGELDKYIETQKQTVKDYPVPMEGEHPHYALSMTYYTLGQHNEALAEAREQVRTVPDNSWSYLALLRVYCALNRLNEAKAASNEAGARHLDGPYLRVSRYVLAFAQGDSKGMEEQMARAGGKPDSEHRLLSAASDTEAYYGRFAKARELTRQAVDSARNAGEKEAAAAWEGQGALREAEVGNVSQAEHMATQSLSLADSDDPRVLAALTLSAAGDSVQAQKLADQIDRERPLDTLVQYYWLPMIRAQIEMTALKPEEGLQGLTITSPYDLGSPGFKQEPFANLYPVYVRGKAYLQAGQGQRAAAEFQEIVDHHGLVCNFIIGALAQLQLGRAQAMMGNKEAARKSYQDFLALWKDADPDIPIYKQAKAEYARLR